MSSIHRRCRRSLVSVSLAVGVLALCSPVLAGTSAEFIPLGFLDPDQFGPVIAYGMSADGSVVVGESNSPTGFQAFRWTDAAGIVGLGAFDNPGGFKSSTARACSADGSVIVGASSLPNSLNEDGSPFRWTAQTGLVFLGSLGGSDGGVARGVSTDGSVVAGYGSNANFDPEAFRWTASGLVGLGDLAGGTFNSQASAVSGNGTLVVGLASTAPFPYDRSFKWTQASGIQPLGPGNFGVIGLSRDGVFAAGRNLGRAARVEVATGNVLMIPHIAIPGLNTDTDMAWAANADGSVITGMMNLSQGNGFFGRAFIWDAQHGTRIVRDMLVNDFGLAAQLAGWELNTATTVSDDGRSLAGYGFAPSGQQAAWLVRLHDLPGEPVCTVDTIATACPCAQGGTAGHGCANSQNPNGALLTASGTISPDTIDFTVIDLPPSTATIYLQGDALVASGVVFGDGVLCASGQLKRLGLKIDTDLDGSTSFGPSFGDPQVSVVGAITPGNTYYYQTYYRNPNPSWCPPATFNISNGVAITWQ